MEKSVYVPIAQACSQNLENNKQKTIQRIAIYIYIYNNALNVFLF